MWGEKKVWAPVFREGTKCHGKYENKDKWPWFSWPATSMLEVNYLNSSPSIRKVTHIKHAPLIGAVRYQKWGPAWQWNTSSAINKIIWCYPIPHKWSYYCCQGLFIFKGFFRYVKRITLQINSPSWDLTRPNFILTVQFIGSKPSLWDFWWAIQTSLLPASSVYMNTMDNWGKQCISHHWDHMIQRPFT